MRHVLTTSTKTYCLKKIRRLSMSVGYLVCKAAIFKQLTNLWQTQAINTKTYCGVTSKHQAHKSDSRIKSTKLFRMRICKTMKASTRNYLILRIALFYSKNLELQAQSHHYCRIIHKTCKNLMLIRYIHR